MSTATTTRRRRSWRQLVVIVGAVAVLTGLGVLVAAPPSVSDDGPEGTVAWRRLAARHGHDVREADRPVDGATFVLVDDLRTEPDAQAVLDWVRAGGNLVTAAPRSALADLLGVRPVDRAAAAFTGTAALTPGCAVPETAGVQQIIVRVSDPVLEADDRVAVGCFPGGSGAPWLVVRSVGDGRAVVLGSPSPATNEFLTEADDARLALALLGDGPVVFGTPTVLVGDQSLLDFLPDPALGVLVGALAAAVLYALARARRFGMPAPETPPTPVPASALVDATAALWRSSGDTEHVAGILRGAALGRLRHRLHLPDDAPDRQVVDLAAAAIGRDRDEVDRIVAARAGSQEQLLTVAQDLRDLLDELEHTR